ncbi:hypothetical protein K458DRAFT_64574 [Lentithecium fluviatile CBS 122367]|uniref:Uncharacterized protein n=1 Tax=Lentithecium fluviatile CBS 122367 TaxID=1168545 RepID=A0A6G1JK62_9PLEO|nr:hypothetical protein K458DRAFT_64574 [Lentithecium fluviatile CBS 122367]
MAGNCRHLVNMPAPHPPPGQCIAHICEVRSAHYSDSRSISCTRQRSSVGRWCPCQSAGRRSLNDESVPQIYLLSDVNTAHRYPHDTFVPPLYVLSTLDRALSFLLYRDLRAFNGPCSESVEKRLNELRRGTRWSGSHDRAQCVGTSLASDNALDACSLDAWPMTIPISHLYALERHQPGRVCG